MSDMNIRHQFESANSTAILVDTFWVGGMLYQQLSKRNPHHLSSLPKKIDVILIPINLFIQ